MKTLTTDEAAERARVIAETLRRGIQVGQVEDMDPGYFGLYQAPFNESSEGNLLYEVAEGINRLKGTKVVSWTDITNASDCVFTTPDGVVAMSLSGTFWAMATSSQLQEMLLKVDFRQETAWIDYMKKSRAVLFEKALPDLLTNTYRAVFAPDTLPDHWKA